MKKAKLFLVLSLLLIPLGFVRAANVVSIDADTNIVLTNPAMTLILKSGSTYSSMVVNEGNIVFTVSAGGSFVLVSNDKYILNSSDDSGGSKNVSCGTSNSRLTYSVAADSSDDGVITVVPGTALCDGGGSSSGGSSNGGGSSASVTNAQPATGTQAVSTTINGANGGSVATADAKAAVLVPQNLTTGNISLNITPVASSAYGAPDSNYGAVAKQVYNFSLTTGGEKLTEFSSPVVLTFKYSADDVYGLDENSLKIYSWDEINKKWVLAGGTLDKNTKSITLEVGHFSIYGLFGVSTVSFAGDQGLIKMICPKNAGVTNACKSVYYLDGNGKRYVFPNEKTYYSWYKDFSEVKSISQEKMYTYEIGGNVTMRPGTYLIKLTTDPKVYAVEPGGKLRWLESEEVATKLYGVSWYKKIVDVSDGFFTNYNSTDAKTNKVSDKHPEGSLIRYVDSPDIYLMSNNVKRKIVDANAFNNNKFRSEFVIETDINYENGADVVGVEAEFKINGQ
ncbi:MAG TPA: hypothetical protein PLK76_04005 [bacterium]|nr:hypothetical protein [bacterium]